MAVPKKKVSPGRRNTRRQFYELSPVGYISCPNCLELRRPHRVCASCGHYNTRQVLSQQVSATEEAKA